MSYLEPRTDMHACALPDHSRLDDAGKRWQCDECGTVWVLTGRVREWLDWEPESDVDARSDGTKTTQVFGDRDTGKGGEP